MDFWELFHGVEIVWVTWFFSVVLMGLLVRHLLIRLVRLDYRAMFARLSLRQIHNDTSGAAYSLSFIMVFPFLVLLIALIIETTFMLVTKIGTMHATFAAARTASVWTTRDANFKTSDSDFLLAQAKAQQAAVMAMVPYSRRFESEIPEAFEDLQNAINQLTDDTQVLFDIVRKVGDSMKGKIDIAGISEGLTAIPKQLDKMNGSLKLVVEEIKDLQSRLEVTADAMRYVPAALKYWAIYEFYNLPIPHPLEKKPNLRWHYIVKKYIYAAKYVSVELPKLNDSIDKWKQHIEAKVTYDYQFQITPIGIFFGEKKDGAYFYKIASAIRINNECPRNKNGSLGIKITP